MDLDLLASLNVERAARRGCILLTDLDTGMQRLVRQAAVGEEPNADELTARFEDGRSGLAPDGTTFLSVHRPATRLVVVGAVHISQALAPMARVLGLDVTIIDPRTAFAGPDRFPDTVLIPEWPEIALPRIGGLDPYVALVCLTHDPKIDDPALVAGLAAGCFYVGALGSRRTHAKRMERLEALGVTPERIRCIRAPIGLDIGAVTPAEIAVSVLGQIVSTMRGGGRRGASGEGG